VAGRLTLRGEFAIVVEARLASTGRDVATGPALSASDLASARAEVDGLVASGLKRSDAVRRVAATTGLDRRTLYRPD
jgi:16S rRNA C1402 (ribose-2'-O) methylase RsmI